MTSQAQHDFIKDLIHMVEQRIAMKTLPEEWDEIELRIYIAEAFEQQTWHRMISGERRRAYMNTIKITDL